ncbi:MAG: arsenate reductase ArsC [Armatimonadetes bacterium]|nr:arsenate reductase ArsC [Armatimonadota bacterium]
MRPPDPARKSCVLEPNHKLKILFLCTGNSCRSQMAEGWARALKSDTIEPYSAGIEAHGMNAYAIKAMAQAGLDITRHYSKLASDLFDIEFDYVITLCSHADSTCPSFPGAAKVVHVAFDDPYTLARDAESEEQALVYYTRIRDELKAYVETLPEALG